MKQIDKIKKQLIKEAEYSIETFYEINDNFKDPRWIEWNLNSETWAVCTGKCKCGNQSITTESTFEKALNHFSDKEILNYYKQQEVA
jgi:hypothetical protein